jgi:hypothetical protein
MNGLQKAIDQIGELAVRKAIPQGYGIGRCTLHGAYMVAPTQEPCCPICPATPPANGTTATDVEHYIDMQPVKGANPQQQVNPYGV